jgi:3-mercaptopyruvate sulfurtransferase SseA
MQQAIGKDGILLVDARSAEMYRGEFHPGTQRGGHISGAINTRLVCVDPVARVSQGA